MQLTSKHVGSASVVEHDTFACGTAHDRPQAPQLAAVLSMVSQPFVATMSQSPRPDVQALTHSPLTHASVTPGREMHSCPQAPQLRRSALRFSSQPLVTSWSQSPRPDGHTSGASRATSSATSASASTTSPTASSVGTADTLYKPTVVLFATGKTDKR